MATVGQALTTPETGWQRIDDKDSKINYINGNDVWVIGASNPSCYNSTRSYFSNINGSQGCKIQFKFKGTKLRILALTASSYASEVLVDVDGSVELCSQYSGSTSYQILCYEKTDLQDNVHAVTMYTNQLAQFGLDAIDIDDTGYLVTQVGQVLTTPDTGWQRIDDRYLKFKYSGTWTQDTGSYYATTRSYTSTLDSKVTFRFYGTKIRIISTYVINQTSNMKIIIDGVEEGFVTNPVATTTQVLAYEKNNLQPIVHTVEISLSAIGSSFQFDAIDIDSTGYMTTQVGSALTAPDPTWKRYDDSNSMIITNGTKLSGITNYYNLTYTEISSVGAYIIFKFKGTRFRIISTMSNSRTDNDKVYVDGIQVGTFNCYNASAIFSALVYESTILSDGIHEVKIEKVGTTAIAFDAIDIDDVGYLVHPILPQKSSLADMEIGDMIPCRYKATSGAVGIFSELGTCTATEIPVASSATPDGSFNFIKVDKGLLIADRVVQHSVSWDALNSGKLIEGNTDPSLAKLANPATLPTGTGYGATFSPDGTYMVVVHSTTPFITIYKRSGDVFTKLDNPSILPTGTGNGVAFSPDGNYLTIAHTVTPFITIYKREGDVFTKLANPTTLPTGTGKRVAFSPDGTYMSVVHVTTPYVTIYKRNGDVFTKLDNPTTLPTANGFGIAFSPDGNYLTIAHTATPYITIYKREGDVFTKLANPTTLPTGTTYGVTFSPDGIYMATVHDATPFMTIYKRDGDVFTKLTNPQIVPLGSSWGVAFSPDGKFVSLATTVSPYVTMYRRDGDVFTKLPNLATLPTDVGTETVFSPDGIYMVISHDATPYVTIYKTIKDVLIRSLSGGNSYVDYTSKRIVSTLLHMDGENGSSSFLDSSPNPKVWTKNGSAMIKTDQSVFGGSSAYFNGSTDYITTPANADFNFGADDFTIDFRIKRSRIGVTEYFFGQSDSAITATTVSCYGRFNTVDTLKIYINSGSSSYICTSTNVLTDTTSFHHIEITRRGTNIYLYVDGIEWATATIGTVAVNSATTPFTIGRLGDRVTEYFQGYIDEFRIIKGKAEHTANFTPPTEPYSEPENTLLGAFSVTTDKGLGAFPPINEWDKYIVNSDLGGKITKGDDKVWHWKTQQSHCKETPISGITVSGVYGGTTNTSRMLRGYDFGVGKSAFDALVSSGVATTVGFRPVLNYLESDSKATTLWY